MQPLQAGAGRVCCRSMQGCGLSADGNPLLQHCKAGWWHFGDHRGCRTPPSPSSPAQPWCRAEHPAGLLSTEKGTRRGGLSSAVLFSGLHGFCCGSVWGWGCYILLVLEHLPSSSPVGVTGFSI